MLGLSRLDTTHFDNFNEFGPTLPKRRFLQTTETDVVENGITSLDPIRNRTVFKGYYAGSPPALLGRVDARYLIRFIDFYVFPNLQFIIELLCWRKKLVCYIKK